MRSERGAELAAAALLVAALVFGGGPRGLGDAVVHALAVPALLLAVLRWPPGGQTRLQRRFAAWWLAAAAVIALQLLPLPAEVFARLPQRAAVLADLRAAGLDPAWLPMTLDRWATVRGLLAILSVGAMWALASTLSGAAQRRLLWLAVAVVAGLALLGFAQAAGGTRAPRFFDFHHPMGAIGSFANRNHFASLLGMLAPVALALGARLPRERAGLAMLAYGLSVLLLLAAALSYSRAGFALAVAAYLIVLVIVATRPGRARWRVPALVGTVAAIAVASYATAGLTARLVQDVADDLRWQYLRHGITAMRDFLPWGSGAGTFPWAYAPREPLVDMVSVYAERAHNDLLQVLVGAGIPGGLLMAWFAALVAATGLGTFLMARDGASREDPLPSVAFVAACVPLVHALVDYPLRTFGVAIVFALLLAVVHGAFRDLELATRTEAGR